MISSICGANLHIIFILTQQILFLLNWMNFQMTCMIKPYSLDVGVPCGSGFALQSFALRQAQRAKGFPLQSLTQS